MGNAPPTVPMFFLKPTSSFVKQGNPIYLPRNNIIHHEVELAVIIGKDGSRIKKERAMDHVAGYALALDMTARNIQVS